MHTKMLYKSVLSYVNVYNTCTVRCFTFDVKYQKDRHLGAIQQVLLAMVGITQLYQSITTTVNPPPPPVGYSHVYKQLCTGM